MSISSSSSSTVGPCSMISVWLPLGSMTAVEVRDSRRIRTKSLRMPSLVRPSMIDAPVRPPASPVAMTGSPKRLSVRAMLMPLPPASASASEARLRVPDWKLGTVRVRSSAALRVTVTITSTHRRDGRCRDERPDPDDACALAYRDAPQHLTRLNRCRHNVGEIDCLAHGQIDSYHRRQ